MQQKMMLFTPAVGVIYGLWFFLAPNSYWSVMTVPVDLISDLASNQLQNTGLALLVISYVLIATRKYINLEKNGICRGYLTDIQYLEHMIPHHQVAIDMSELLEPNTNNPVMSVSYTHLTLPTSDLV